MENIVADLQHMKPRKVETGKKTVRFNDSVEPRMRALVIKGIGEERGRRRYEGIEGGREGGREEGERERKQGKIKHRRTPRRERNITKEDRRKMTDC